MRMSLHQLSGHLTLLHPLSFPIQSTLLGAPLQQIFSAVDLTTLLGFNNVIIDALSQVGAEVGSVFISSAIGSGGTWTADTFLRIIARNIIMSVEVSNTNAGGNFNCIDFQTPSPTAAD